MNGRFLVATLVLAMMGGTMPALAAVPTPRPQAYGPGYGPPQNGWDQPPQEYRDVQRRGFHDGIEAARHDFHDGRPPDPAHHEMFRNPPAPPPDRHDYREAFRRGYFMAMHHMHDGMGPGPR